MAILEVRSNMHPSPGNLITWLIPQPIQQSKLLIRLTQSRGLWKSLIGLLCSCSTLAAVGTADISFHYWLRYNAHSHHRECRPSDGPRIYCHHPPIHTGGLVCSPVLPAGEKEDILSEVCHHDNYHTTKSVCLNVMVRVQRSVRNTFNL